MVSSCCAGIRNLDALRGRRNGRGVQAPMLVHHLEDASFFLAHRKLLTMEKYRLVQEHKADDSVDFLDSTSTSFPEVRITQQGKPRNYISYAMNLFVCLYYRQGGVATSICLLIAPFLTYFVSLGLYPRRMDLRPLS